MKEATGEANMTIVTVIIIGVVAALGGVIVNSLMSGVGQKSCVENGGTWNGQTNQCTY